MLLQHVTLDFQEKYLFQGCGFSLWHLEPSMRKNWLSAVMVIMYKYNFSPDTAMGERVTSLGRLAAETPLVARLGSNCKF